jgi:hypothetical protein
MTTDEPLVAVDTNTAACKLLGVTSLALVLWKMSRRRSNVRQKRDSEQRLCPRRFFWAVCNRCDMMWTLVHSTTRCKSSA